MLTIGILQTNWGQNWLARQVTKKLSRELQTHIDIKRVEFGFFNRMDLEGFLIKDQKKDTLLWAGTLQVRITDWFFFKDRVDLKYIALKDAQINLNRTDSIWNYQFLADYFNTPSKKKNNKETGIEFNLKTIEMDNVSFVKKDAWVGSDLYAKVTSLDVDAKNISTNKKLVDITDIVLVNPFIHLYNYTGKKLNAPVIVAEDKTITADSLIGWNPENWKVSINSITVKN